MDDYKKIRVLYEKKGRARYISHLDINRLMQRVLKRAGLPVWYTEGFNPHMYLTFALPLSLGCESEAEYMDFRLTEDLPFDEICRRFNDSLPEGIHVREAFAPIHKTAEIARADYRILLQAGCGVEDAEKKLGRLLGHRADRGRQKDQTRHADCRSQAPRLSSTALQLRKMG